MIFKAKQSVYYKKVHTTYYALKITTQSKQETYFMFPSLQVFANFAPYDINIL